MGYTQLHGDSLPTLYFTNIKYCPSKRPCEKCDLQTSNDRIQAQTFQFTETSSGVLICDINHNKYIAHATDQQNTQQ
jgi:hypothetical protein